MFRVGFRLLQTPGLMDHSYFNTWFGDSMKVQYNSLTMLLIKSLLFKHLIGKISDTKFVTFRSHHNTIIKTKIKIS